jgi:hypothetical protein
LKGQSIEPFQAQALHPTRGPANTPGKEVECASNPNRRRNRQLGLVAGNPEFLGWGAKGHQKQIRAPGMNAGSYVGEIAWPRRSGVGARDHQPAVTRPQDLGGGVCDAGRATEQEQTPARDRAPPRQILHQIDAAYPLRKAITEDTGGPDDSDPIRDRDGCLVQDAAELAVAPGGHHELGIHRDHLPYSAGRDKGLYPGRGLGDREPIDGHP